MSNTFYIDTNRQNSTKKSKESNNEWEYKLSNTLQIPTGSEIGIEQIFIHQSGISGGTIQITEDINETMYFSVYLTDNPHWIPKNQFVNDNRTDIFITKDTSYQPSFLPFGQLANKAVYNPKNDTAFTHYDSTGKRYGNETTIDAIQARDGGDTNCDKIYAIPHAQQRIALWEDDGETNPRLFQGDYGIINDPFLTGYSELPMMAIYVDGDSTYTDTAYDNFGSGSRGSTAPFLDTDLADPRFRPYVKSVDIFIAKGVYSIGEIGDIIENQINGKYVNLKNDDYYTDTITQKQNTQSFDGGLDTSGIYTKADPFDRGGAEYGGLKSDNLEDPNEANSVFNINDNLKYVFSHFKGSYNASNHAIDTENSTLYPTLNPTGLRQIGNIHNDAYGLPYYPSTTQTTIATFESNGSAVNKVVPKRLLAYGQLPAIATPPSDSFQFKPTSHQRGRYPKLPTTKQLFYIPVHYYNQLVKMWKYEDFEGGVGSATAAKQNSYLIQTGNWTVNTRRYFRYGFQGRQNAYNASTLSNNGMDMGGNGQFIGLHHKVKTNTYPDFYHTGTDLNKEEECMIYTTPSNFNYDVMKNGYYVGTPDFTFGYSSDMSAYTLGGLHQSLRIPSIDQQGNPMASEGESCVFVRRHATLQLDTFVNPARTQSKIAGMPNPPTDPDDIEYKRRFDLGGGTDGFKQRIKNVLNNNESRLGGVAVYNWGYKTALKYGDITPATLKIDPYDNNKYKAYHNDYQHLWKFSEFFSTKEKALDAWKTTIWSRLGFSYDNLQNEDNWETHGYYDLPVNLSNETSEDDLLGLKNSYYEERTNMYFKKEDFKLYGLTTKGDIDAASAPTISTTYNNQRKTYIPAPSTNPDPAAAAGKAVKPKHPTPPAPAQNNTTKEIVRTYDNNDTATPFFASTGTIRTADASSNIVKGLLPNDVNGDEWDNTYPLAFVGSTPYNNSMYISKTRVPVLTESKVIVASKLPALSQQGYYIITSDIVDNYQDDIKEGQPLALLGIVPLSNLSNQDFISAESDLTHTTQQVKNINSIKIKILNPDLTAPTLLENSSVILRISTPLPQNTPMTPQQTDDNSNQGKQGGQPNPHDSKTKSG